MRKQENRHGDDDGNYGSHHIVMLPFMAHGHLVPFLALAKQIAQRSNFKITIATTPLNVTYLESATSDKTISSGRIFLRSLPFDGKRHNLPPHAENTEALPLSLIVNLFHASSSLKQPLENLIKEITAAENGAPPLCIVSDVFMGWANEVAASYDTVNVAFSTGGAYGTAAYSSIWLNLPHRKADEDEFTVPGFPDSCVFSKSQLHHYLRAADGTDSWSRFFRPQIEKSLKSSALLLNTCEEIEPLGLHVIRGYTKLPVGCVGPLLPRSMLVDRDQKSPSEVGKHTGREPGVSVERCLEWLDSRGERSVLYVSFGSQNTIGAAQMMALAAGLEGSGRPFVWVIRPPVGFDSKEEFRAAEWLPSGFEERVAEGAQGLVVRRWAPQLDILCHRSTGAFLSHCGWNSTMESLSQGVPIIGWPLAAEQGYNAKMLVEEMGVCVEMTRGVESSITAEQVAGVIETAMGGGDKAGDMKRKASEIAAMIRASMTEEGSRKGSSLKALDDFLDGLIGKRANRKAI